MNGALARHPYVAPVMRLASHVVVMAVDDGSSEEISAPGITSRTAASDVLHHDLAVDLRIGLRPVDRIHVVVEVIGALIEPSERGIGQPDLPSSAFSRAMPMKREAMTLPTPREPEWSITRDAVCIRGEFDEVVARSQASELALPGHGHHALEEFGMTVERLFMPSSKGSVRS